jgi:CubicO group peptidase (beta-lactamase class C family)
MVYCSPNLRPELVNNFRNLNNSKSKEHEPKILAGLQLVVIKNSKIVLSETRGLADVEFSVSVTDSTIFSINSLTRVFTGTAIMQLIEQGKICLDIAIGNYLDSLPAVWRQITLKRTTPDNLFFMA